MGRRNNKFVMNDFYCMNCGSKNLTLPRRDSHQHERFHRKIMYCFHCKQEVNHVECKTYEDVLEFKENFENGVYVNEAAESISYVRTSRIGENNLGQRSNQGHEIQVCTCIKR